MSEARINRISNEKGDGGPSLSGITTFSGLNYFVPPKGTTAERPSDCPPGSIRFNTDSAHLEYFDGLQWLEFEATNNELGIANNAAGTSGGLGHRGLFGAGYNGTASTNDMDMITIATLGDAVDFGNSITTCNRWGGCASRTRGYWFGGGSTNIDTVVFSSSGSASDYGNLSASSDLNAGCSNSTRGINATAGTGNSQNIDYFALESGGTAVSFGNLTIGRNRLGSTSNSVRGIFAGGYLNAPGTPQGNNNTIDYITISTTGNAQDFGDAVQLGHALSGASNSIRGIFSSQNAPSALTNVIQFITFATTGNAQDFGDLTVVREYTGSVSSPTRCVIAGGNSSPGTDNVMDYITITTTGNAVDFGDLTQPKMGVSGCSNGHGGL
jgi:hypothetical protein